MSVPSRSSSAPLVGIVPAAGRGTRLQPLAGSKEVLDVGGRPLMDFLLERMELAGARVRVVTRPDKHDVVEHARARGAEVVLGAPPTLAASIALGAQGLPPDTLALIGFPDSIWEPSDAYVQLAALATGRRAAVALGLFGVSDTSSCDVATVAADGRVTDIEIRDPAARSRLMWGIAVARVEALDGMGADDWPSRRFKALAARGEVVGLHVSDEYSDLGTRPALEAALARARP